MSLDTLTNVKLRLGIATSDDDALLAALMDAADQYVASHCGRDFAGGPFTEYHAGDAAFVFLRNYPVDAITSVKVDPAYGFGADTILATTAYVVHIDRGVIESLAGPFVRCSNGAPRAVQVEYAVATGAVPADVKEAYALLIGHWYRHVKTQAAANFQDVTQQTFGDTTAIFAKEQIAGLPVPSDIPLLLGAYRVPVI
jgi:uncharacterized phiE125 gp8 family phage protein